MVFGPLRCRRLSFGGGNETTRVQHITGCLGVCRFARPRNSAIAEYPERPVTIIVPFAAGGPSDVVARILADRMRLTLKQPVLVENVTGAGGSIGVTRAVRSAPDGYTISFGHLGTHVFNGAIYPLTFNLLTDLEPVAMLPSNPMVIVSKNDLSAKTLKEFIAWAKQNSGKVSAGTAGAGSGSHIGGVYFENSPVSNCNSCPIAAPARRSTI